MVAATRSSIQLFQRLCRDLWPRLVIHSATAYLAPWFLAYLVLGRQSMDLVGELRGSDPESFTSLFQMVTPFSLEAIGIYLLLYYWTSIASFTWLLALQHHEQAKPPEGFASLISHTLRGYWLKAPVIYSVIFLTILVAISALGFLGLLLMIGLLMAPTLLLLESSGMFQALGRGLKFAYCPKELKFHCFFQFSMIGSVFISVWLGIELAEATLLTALPFTPQGLSFWPPGGLHLAVTLVCQFLQCLAINFFLMGSFAFYRNYAGPKVEPMAV